MGLIAVLLVGLGIYFFVLFFVLSLIAFLIYITNAIAFFMMAKKAGYSSSWFSFIPILQFLIPTVLPHRKYILASFRPQNRITVFWVMLVLPIAAGFTLGIYAIVRHFTNELGNIVNSAAIASDRPVFLDIVFIAGTIIAFLICLVCYSLLLVWKIMRAKIDYDLFMTYQIYNLAPTLSIILFFVPFLRSVFYLILIFREPEYGYGNYGKGNIVR